MKKKVGLLFSLILISGTLLSACGNRSDVADSTNNNITIGMAADVGGIDDKSFNQSTWEGIQKFAKKHGLEKGTEYRYLPSSGEADYVPNLTQFAESGFDLIFGVGFLLATPVKEVAAQFPDSNFAIIDSEVAADNVVSIMFEENVGSFLAGVAAALSTKTNTVGFIGGVDSDTINKFEAGFVDGAKSVNPDIHVISSYAGSFASAERGATLAATIYSKGADIIYHAAGATGNGIFTEAKNRAANGETVWVIGVDRDQNDEGLPENVTLTSMLKRVDIAAYDVATKVLEGNFQGGKTLIYGLEEDGVGLTNGNLSEAVIEKVEAYKQKILDGEITVISTKAEKQEKYPEME